MTAAAEPSVVRRFLGFAYRHSTLVVVAKRLDDEGRRARAARGHRGHGTAGLTVREGSPAEVAHLVASSGNPSRRRRTRAYLLLGYRCFVGFLDDEPIGHLWWVDNATRPRHPRLKRLGITLGEREVYGFDYFVLPERRGRALSADLLRLIEDELSRRGYRILYGYVDTENAKARWLYMIEGYDTVRTVGLREILRCLVIARGRVFLSSAAVHGAEVLMRTIRSSPRPDLVRDDEREHRGRAVGRAR